MASTFIVAVDIIMASLFLLLLITFRDYKRRRGLPYPPGPKPWPIIGNLLDSPKQLPWIAYTEMSKKYGDILYLQVFGQSVVVLCSLSVVKDLFEKRGDIYSDRPAWPMPEIMGVDWLLAFTRYGEDWRERRKIADRILRPGAMSLYHRRIEGNTHAFLSRLLVAPADFRGHVDLSVVLSISSYFSLEMVESRRSQGQLIMSLVYGYNLKENDEIIKAPVQLLRVLSRFVLPGAALVNHFPLLRHIPSWVPWFSYESLARLGRELGHRTMNEPIDFVKSAMRDGTAVLSLAREQLLEVKSLNGPERQLEEDVIKRVLGSMYEAGVDTAASTTTSLFVALTLYPEVQRRAQAQIDSVVSRDRLPTFKDRSRLPYIEAICKELLRWQMVAPMGFPHASTEDGVYRGFFIPKGSMMIVNSWGILHNPELYPDPETFNPERFLNEDGTFRDDPMISLAFGGGKRICPARHLADMSLFMIAVSVLSVFNVTKAKDENGYEIPVSPMVEVNAVVCYPAKFECSIRPRDKVAEDLIRDNQA
ncbi:cytochrome P450 [Lactarius akahatsu]|uniref:Cytochrome P450 n=1 Tax=Lactarius akahatsu TaxID=416441 RepID=A0AAD4QCB9_9AGAM|nr:cytochrome P450 [Lactarius akahatsu]